MTNGGRGNRHERQRLALIALKASVVAVVKDGTSLARLKDPDLIKPGQVLKLP
jgi:hypothetical protein